MRQAYLSHVRADRQDFEEVASADEVSGLVLRVEQVRCERLRPDGIILDEFPDAREREVIQGNPPESIPPILKMY